MANRGWFDIDQALGYWRIVAGGIIVALVATIVSAPIVVYLFGGTTPGAQGALVAAFLASGQQIWTSVFAASFISEPIDKTISIAVAYAIAQAIPLRYLPRRGMEALGEG